MASATPAPAAARRVALVIGISLLCCANGCATSPPASVTQDASAERRLALVVGNQEYRSSPLVNPVNDARAVAGALRRVGFDVTLATDLDAVDLERSVESFAQSLREGDVAVFFYSGHGMQMEGTNYLIPVDLDSVDPIGLKYHSLSAQLVQEKLENAKTRVAILVLDACRDNPFRGSRGGDRGLASMTARRAGTLIAFSTGPGRVAADDDDQPNSTFSAALASAITEPGLEVKRLFDQVGARVSSASQGRQLPWLNSNLYDEFYFATLPATDAPTESAAKKLQDQANARRRERERAAGRNAEQSPVRSTPSIEPTSGRFRVVGDGTVIDTRTGLQWASQDNGSSIDWAGAVRHAANLSLGGHSDWRLPTQAELWSLYLAGQASGAGYHPDCVWFSPVGATVMPPREIRFSCSWMWASEAQGERAAYVDFHGNGTRGMTRKSDSFATRALPVRTAR